MILPSSNSVSPALFPDKPFLWGPVTKQHIARFFGIYLCLFVVCGALYVLSPHLGFKIFSLGLMFPGGGFLAFADVHDLFGILSFLSSAFLILLVFMLSLIVWIATGNVLSPLLTWLGLAVAASLTSHPSSFSVTPWILLKILFFLAGSGGIFLFFCQWSYRQTRQELNTKIKSSSLITANFLNYPPLNPSLSTEDLKRMRFLLDRALQPLNEFQGFEFLDQFQTAAIRYQINVLGCALSMAQATYLPAFGGYLNQAQSNLIKKNEDYRVWHYWALENMWGNLNFNPDPCARENIMFTGFVATQMAMYHAAANRKDFETSGSFSLQSPEGKKYTYDLPRLIEKLESEIDRSAFGLVACEPNWIYPLCNTIGTTAIKAYAPTRWAKHEGNFRRSFENEFIDRQGCIIPCRSRYTGFALPTFGGVMPQALPCFFLNATLPDLALRQWLLTRHNLLDQDSLRKGVFWRIDTGNYGFSRASAYAATALAAAELGDEEIKKLCFNALEEECPTYTNSPHYYRPHASVWSHAVEFFARCAVKNGFRDLINRSYNTSQCLRIENVRYPDLMVAQATSTPESLHAIFDPIVQGIHTIKISGLKQGRIYACHGAQETMLLADQNGSAQLSLVTNGRCSFEIKEAG